MSATVAAALKKIAVYILTDKKALKVVGGIILGIIIIIIMPIVALLGIFTGSVDIDTDRLHEMIAEQQSVAIESWTNVETAMTNAGYDSLRIQEAQALFTFALYDHASEPDFTSKLVGCFSAEQTDEELISAVNAAFGTNIVAADFTNVMASTRAAYIDSSGYTDPTTKNSTDLVMWAEFAHAKGWGYVWGTYGDVLDKNLFEYKKTQYPDEVGGKAEYIEANWLGGRTADCVGLIKGYAGYFFTPLDFVSSPNSMWYDDVKHGIEQTFDYWLDNINEQGVWNPNFSWGIDSDVSRQVTENWKGYITVKRAKILLNFGRIEK